MFRRDTLPVVLPSFPCWGGGACVVCAQPQPQPAGCSVVGIYEGIAQPSLFGQHETLAPCCCVEIG